MTQIGQTPPLELTADEGPFRKALESSAERIARWIATLPDELKQDSVLTGNYAAERFAEEFDFGSAK